MSNNSTQNFRNRVDVTSIEGIEVDAGSLWKMQDNLLILIDDDQHVTKELSSDFIIEK